jgi:hypothetical protein
MSILPSWDEWVWPPGPVGVAGGSGGKIVNNTTTNVEERAGLGSVPLRWPELRILAPGPKVLIAPDHSRAVIQFKIPWKQHYRLCAELVGWPYVDSTGFHRHLPEQYRLWNFQLVSDVSADPAPTPVMYCTSAEPQGLGYDPTYTTQNPDRLGLAYYPDPQFEFAIVTATFETLTFDVELKVRLTETPALPYERQRYVLKTEESGGRFLSFATGQWALYDATKTPPYLPDINFRSFQYWEPFQTITYEWFDVLPEAFNHERNQTYCGCTNHAIWDNKQPGTLLLLKADRKPKKSPLGQRVYYVKYEFLYVPSGVNKAQPPGPAGIMYDPGTGTYTPIYYNVIRQGTKDNTQPAQPYQPKNMSDLFRP